MQQKNTIFRKLFNKRVVESSSFLKKNQESKTSRGPRRFYLHELKVVETNSYERFITFDGFNSIEKWWNSEEKVNLIDEMTLLVALNNFFG